MSNTAIEKRESQANVPERVERPERVEQATYFTPLVDVVETGDAFLFQADLPGVEANDLDVGYENGTLTIEGKAHPRQPAGQRYVWREFGVGHFYRQFTLNAPIDPDKIKAQLKNGVLELWVPKAESAKARRIEIKTA